MTNSYSILHLDDDPLEHRAFARYLKQSAQDSETFKIQSALDSSTFLTLLNENINFDFILLDIHLAGDANSLSGFNLIETVKKIHPQATLLMSSNFDDPNSVLESLKLGADEFLSKKYRIDQLAQRLISIRQKTLIKKGLMQNQFTNNHHTKLISGDLMKKIELRVPNIINSAIKFVYVEGESGTGKEVVADLFAQFLKDRPFVKLNCAGIPKDLIESELFGHKKGSFTGAHNDKKGVIEAANGGWLFLDEVSSLTPSAQSVLLRTFENQEVTPIGETRARKINVRFISASNIPISQMVLRGEFRNDLWQRLREIEISLSPLHLRPQEIPDLIQHFCQTMDRGPYSIENTALHVLCQLKWKEGNVRELRNCLRAMTENHNEKVLSPMSIPKRILASYHENILQKKSNSDLEFLNNENNYINVPIKNKEGLNLSYEEMSNELLKQILNYYQKMNGKINITKISQEFKISRSTLQLKMKQFNHQQNCS